MLELSFFYQLVFLIDLLERNVSYMNSNDLKLNKSAPPGFS